MNKNGEETEWKVFGWFIDGIQFHSEYPFTINDFDKFASLSQSTLLWFIWQIYFYWIFLEIL
jgi:hypothetical protein